MFNTELYDQRETCVVRIMNKLESSPDLLIEVVELTVKSRLGDRRIPGPIDSAVLTRVVEKCLKWPDGLAANARNILELEASKALVKVNIIKIPMVFSTQNTIVISPLFMATKMTFAA